MEVLSRIFFDIDMQCLICMVMVICLFNVNRQMLQLTRALVYAETAQRGQCLPYKYSKEKDGTQTGCHFQILSARISGGDSLPYRKCAYEGVILLRPT